MDTKTKIINWIKSQLKEAGAEGIVLGLSGGVDSSVIAALTVKAVGRNKVLSLILPIHSQIKDLKDARLVAKKLKIHMEKVYVNVDKYGNTSAASIPIALNEARKTERIKEDDFCLMVVFGGGFTWGSALVKL